MHIIHLQLNVILWDRYGFISLPCTSRYKHCDKVCSFVQIPFLCCRLGGFKWPHYDRATQCSAEGQLWRPGLIFNYLQSLSPATPKRKRESERGEKLVTSFTVYPQSKKRTHSESPGNIGVVFWIFLAWLMTCVSQQSK